MSSHGLTFLPGTPCKPGGSGTSEAGHRIFLFLQLFGEKYSRLERAGVLVLESLAAF
jgi:hypothetical protein